MSVAMRRTHGFLRVAPHPALRILSVLSERGRQWSSAFSGRAQERGVRLRPITPGLGAKQKREREAPVSLLRDRDEALFHAVEIAQAARLRSEVRGEVGDGLVVELTDFRQFLRVRGHQRVVAFAFAVGLHRVE